MYKRELQRPVVLCGIFENRGRESRFRSVGERFGMRPHPRRKDIRRDANTNRGWIWMDGFVGGWTSIEIRFFDEPPSGFEGRIDCARSPLRGSPPLYFTFQPYQRKHPTTRIVRDPLFEPSYGIIDLDARISTRKRRIRR